MSKETTGMILSEATVNRRDFVKGGSVVAASTALASLSAKAATLPFSSSILLYGYHYLLNYQIYILVSYNFFVL